MNLAKPFQSIDRGTDFRELENSFQPEQYELHAPLPYKFEVDRRHFFKLLGCGVVTVFLADEIFAQESGSRSRGRNNQRPQEISAWLHIGEDGIVSVFTGKVEVGQNVRTSLTQAVAEELHVSVDSIHMTMADTALTPYDAGTFGSRSTPDMGLQLRKIAALAREALIELALEHFKADRNGLAASDGKIVRNDGQGSVSYADLAKGRQLVRSATAADPVPASQWKVAGTSVRKVNGRAYVTGSHKYTSDLKLPGMLYGKILRPASYGATPVTVNTADAEKIPGVTVVHDGSFIGVTAPNSQIAARAIEAIRADWISQPQISSAELFDHLKKTARQGGGGFTVGSIEMGLAAAEQKLDQTYTIAYIAHAPLEPRAAVAEWENGKLKVWTGTQRPFGVRGDLAKAFGIPEQDVRVIAPDTGSAYGGKHTGEAAIEAARLAKAAGKPVKLVWTREEEFTWAYFRPAGVIEIKSGVRKDGTITAWEFHNYNSGGSGIRTPYDIAHQKIESHSSDSPLRQGSYRGLAATANHFARETHMDELAAALKMDSFEFRMKNLREPRLRAVLEAAAKSFGWGKSTPARDHGFGISLGTEKGSFLATCAEVFLDRDREAVKVTRATVAFECGAIVNPDQLKNQIEGALMMGIGGALFEAIQFEKGKIKNPHFAKYRLPRFNDTPRIEVVLVNRTDLPSAGAGETPIVGIAPAISNAIFAASGVRLRSMPMAPQGLKI
jgi:nicotinate dehydrogenase subunit B